MSHEIATANTPSTELTAALGNTASIVSVMPGVKLSASDKVNMLTNAVSLAKAREASKDQTITVKVVGLSVSPCEFQTEEGELVTGLSAIVISEDGTAYYSQSQPLMRSLGALVGVMGDPKSWKTPILVKFYLRQAGQRMVNSLEVVIK